MQTIRYSGDEGAPVHITGAAGGRIPGGGYVVRFFSEVPELVDGNHDDGTPGIRREVVASIAMTGRTARQIHDWLGRVISEDPGVEPDLRRLFHSQEVIKCSGE